MTTTELIKLLKSVEQGVSGRSREISFSFSEDVKDFAYEPKISIVSTGDGIAGAELHLMISN